MRKNKYQPDDVRLMHRSDKGNRMVRSKTPIVKREKQPHEALPPDSVFHWKKRPEYKPGDMDHTTYVPREGSCHKHIKSFGEST